MSEDLTGCLTDGSTTVTSSLTIRVLSTRGSRAQIKTCLKALQLNFHLMTDAHTLTLSLLLYSQVTSSQSIGSPICLMWNCQKKGSPLKKVPSPSLDQPLCLQSKLLLARCDFIHKVDP